MFTKDKVRGLFLGIGIGDSLGMPVEGWKAEKIKEVHNRVTTYLDPKGHKYHDGMKAGMWTDDTSLSIAVVKSLIDAGGFDMDSQVKFHVAAFKTNTSGWGPTTREAIQRLAEGVSPKVSGTWKAPNEKGKAARGVGNGVVMKLAPLAAYFKAVGAKGQPNAAQDLADFTAMTHPTSVAVGCSFAHWFTVLYCLGTTPDEFNPKAFIFKAINASESGEKYFPETATADIVSNRMKTLEQERTVEEIVKDFTGGRSYVYDSLPFSYAFFLRNPGSIESLYEVVSAGGDTDTNASMVGALLGSLHGSKVFPESLVNGLQKREEIEAVISDFCKTFFPT
jgi:ADP-ribosylglycohydrolase